MSDPALLEKLRKIERLYAGATSTGEKEAAADAMERIRRRLQELESREKATEYRFRLTDDWSKKLFVALLRRYSLQPYRYARQRRNTVMVKVPRSFVDETLWPEFLELSQVLQKYLDDVTDGIIRDGVFAADEAEMVIPGDYLE